MKIDGVQEEFGQGARRNTLRYGKRIILEYPFQNTSYMNFEFTILKINKKYIPKLF